LKLAIFEWNVSKYNLIGVYKVLIEKKIRYFTLKNMLYKEFIKNNFEEYFQSVHMIYILSAQTISR
jgi:hypothetical protein